MNKDIISDSIKTLSKTQLYSIVQVAKILGRNRFLLKHLVDEHSEEIPFIRRDNVREENSIYFGIEGIRALQKYTKEYTTVKELGKLYNMDISNVHRYIKDLGLEPIKFGYEFYYTKEDAERFKTLHKSLKSQNQYVTLRNVHIKYRLRLDMLNRYAESKKLPFVKDHLGKWVMHEDDVNKIGTFEGLSGARTDFDKLVEYVKCSK